jgi:hypothetical protein
MLVLRFLPFLVRVVVGLQYSSQRLLPAVAPDNFIPNDPLAHAILARALRDGIDLTVFAFSGPALHEIIFWSNFDVSHYPRSLLEPGKNSTTIDVHGSFFF